MRRRAGLILGIGFIIAALVAGAGFLLRTIEASDGDDPEQAIPSLPAPDGPVTLVPAERISVTASSSLSPIGSITYGPENVLDGDEDTAWNSNAPAGTNGRGEVLVFRFTDPVDLQKIQFVNGYAKDPTIYSSNHRIEEIIVRTDRTFQTVSLIDTDEEQEITSDFGYTSKVEIEVVAVYVGDGFDDPTITADLALTEIAFLAAQR